MLFAKYDLAQGRLSDYLIALISRGSFGHVVIGTFILTCLLYLPAKKLAVYFNLFDHPDARKDHERPIAYGGGILIVASSLLAGVVFVVRPIISAQWASRLYPFRGELLAEGLPLMMTIFVASLLLFGMGVLDDKVQLGSKAKLALQFLVAVLVVCMGVRADFFSEGPWLGGALSVVWIVGITNSFNLLDNMNGLSAGVAMIALGLFAVVMVITGQLLYAIVLCILLGAVLGFLVFNFPRAKIFLGDGGAYFIGFWIACLTITATFYFKDQELPMLVVAFPLLVMAVPLYDTVTVVLIRLKQGRPIMQADRNHLSHRLLAMGMSRTQAVLSIWVLTLAVGLPSVLMYFANVIGSIIALIQAILVLLLVFMLESASDKKSE